MHALDHLLWEELYLEEGEERFAELTGVAPTYGGVHPEAGTHNSLLSLGPTYLELIALTPERLHEADLPDGTLASFTPGLLAFGVGADDLERVEKLAEATDLQVAHSHEVTRRTPEGALLRWRTLTIGAHNFGNLIPFFTRFDSSREARHPSETAPKGCDLLEFSAGHPEPETLSHLYEALQVDVNVIRSEQPLLRATLATPRGEVALSSRESFR